MDNVRHAVVEVKDRLPILVVDGRPEKRDSRDGDSFFLRPVFRDVLGGYGWQDGTARDLETLDLSKFAFVLLLNVPSLTEPAVKAVEAYCRDGGGVGVWVGPDVNAKAYEETLYRDGAGMLPAPLAAKATDELPEAELDGKRRFQISQKKLLVRNPAVRAHPALAGLYLDERGLPATDVDKLERVFGFITVRKHWPVSRGRWRDDKAVTELYCLPNDGKTANYEAAIRGVVDAIPLDGPEFAGFREVLKPLRDELKRIGDTGEPLYQLANQLDDLLAEGGDSAATPKLREFWANPKTAALKANATRLRDEVKFGDPLILAKQFGRGRVLLVTTTAGDAWTDWPREPPGSASFAPVMKELGGYLSGGGGVSESWPVGKPVELKFSADRFRPVVGRSVLTHDPTARPQARPAAGRGRRPEGTAADRSRRRPRASVHGGRPTRGIPVYGHRRETRPGRHAGGGIPRGGSQRGHPGKRPAAGGRRRAGAARPEGQAGVRQRVRLGGRVAGPAGRPVRGGVADSAARPAAGGRTMAVGAAQLSPRQGGRVTEPDAAPDRELVFRRLAEPFPGGPAEYAPALWVAVTVVALLLAVVWVARLYRRDAVTLHWWLAVPLAAARFAVYALLAVAFLLPAFQTWERQEKRSKVVLLVDVSPSVLTVADERPPDAKTRAPTRLDKLLDALTDDRLALLAKLTAKNPVTVYRFGGRLDDEPMTFTAETPAWTRADWAGWLGGDLKAWLLKPLSPAGRQLLAKTQAWDGDATGTPEWAVGWVRRPDAEAVPDGLGEADKAAVLAARGKLEKRADLVRAVGQGTDLPGAAAAAVNREAGNLVQAVVVFSDGRSPAGTDPTFRQFKERAGRDRVPVFTVAVGEARDVTAIQITDVQAADRAPPDEPFKVAVEADGVGLADATAEVRLGLFAPGRSPKDGKPADVELTRPLKFLGNTSPPHGAAEFAIDPESADFPDTLTEASKKVGKKRQLRQGAWTAFARIARDKREITAGRVARQPAADDPGAGQAAAGADVGRGRHPRVPDPPHAAGAGDAAEPGRAEHLPPERRRQGGHGRAGRAARAATHLLPGPAGHVRRPPAGATTSSAT